MNKEILLDIFSSNSCLYVPPLWYLFVKKQTQQNEFLERFDQIPLKTTILRIKITKLKRK